MNSFGTLRTVLVRCNTPKYESSDTIAKMINKWMKEHHVVVKDIKYTVDDIGRDRALIIYQLNKPE